MKVAFYCPRSLSYGYGIEKWLVEVAGRLSRKGVSVSILATSSTENKPKYDTNVIKERLGHATYIELPFITIPLSRTPMPINSLSPYFEDSDLIYYIDGYAFREMLVLLSKHQSGKPVIFGNHAALSVGQFMHDFYARCILLRLLRRFDAVHALNSDAKKYLEGYTDREVFLIPCGVNTGKYDFRPGKEKADRFSVLFVGSLEYRKGIDITLEVIRLINMRLGINNRIEFVICGDGDFRSQVERASEEYPNIIYLGYREDMPNMYRECDLLLAPSRAETFLVTVVEAQACGLPVVVSNIAGPRDIILNESQGQLVDIDDSRAFADAVIHYYNIWDNDYDSFKRISAECRANAVERYDYDRIIEQMVAMFEKVAAGKHA